jgi:glutamate/tyrosine decarboxylase-like PLP-dependent enzyme
LYIIVVFIQKRNVCWSFAISLTIFGKRIFYMPLEPFSERYPDEFLDRSEGNFHVLLEKMRLFYAATREGVSDGRCARRGMGKRFNYKEELEGIRVNQEGITSEEVAYELNDMLEGCIRHQDPTTAFNIIASPMFDAVAALALTSLYNPNVCWDFISGKLCLYEKKIVRMLGKLVGWSGADGFVVTGGKQAFAYAIRNGIARASHGKQGEMSEYVVLCSAVAHYSIEHVCDLLGISPGNCLRVAARATGEMDLQDLREKLESSFLQGKKIAAVIAVGGATIDLVPDPILLVRKVIDKVARDYELSYSPYLHVDSVITWAWLSFRGRLPTLSETTPQIRRKIESVVTKLRAIQYVDSFAVDFHKTGFCPYAAGVFIARDTENLAGTATRGYVIPENPEFGSLEPLRQTFENSRSAQPIVSIWVALRRMGLKGLRQFVLYQLEVCEAFKHKIRQSYSDHFEILNDQSNGWEIVLKPHFLESISWDSLQQASPHEQQAYTRECYALINEYWYAPLEEGRREYPVIGFVPKYSRKNIHEKAFPAFLIHPTSLHYDESAIDDMLEKIIGVKSAYDLQRHAFAGSYKLLHEMVPPR